MTSNNIRIALITQTFVQLLLSIKSVSSTNYKWETVIEALPPTLNPLNNHVVIVELINMQTFCRN